MDNTNDIKQKGQTSFKSRRLKRKSEVSSYSLHIFQSMGQDGIMVYINKSVHLVQKYTQALLIFVCWYPLFQEENR